MATSGLILTYHAIEPGPGPLFVEPGLFRRHLDCLVAEGARVMKLSELAAAARSGRIPERAVAITFDDGFASVVEDAAPLLEERGFPATVFCVAGHVGTENDWPTQPADAPRRRLAGQRELQELVRAGLEIGCHGFEHAPLDDLDGPDLEDELVTARALLEWAVDRPVRSLAYPYGVPPGPAARRVIREFYDTACAGGPETVAPGADPLALPRVDAYYLLHPVLLAQAVRGSLGPYLRARRMVARARRTIAKDYVAA